MPRDQQQSQCKRTLPGNGSAPRVSGKVSTVTALPSTVWGHVSVWDFVT